MINIYSICFEPLFSRFLGFFFFFEYFQLLVLCQCSGWCKVVADTFFLCLYLCSGKVVGFPEEPLSTEASRGLLQYSLVFCFRYIFCLQTVLVVAKITYVLTLFNLSYLLYQAPSTWQMAGKNRKSCRQQRSLPRHFQ